MDKTAWPENITLIQTYTIPGNDGLILDMTLGDLMEGIVLHSFEGKPPFSKETVRRIDQLKDLYSF